MEINYTDELNQTIVLDGLDLRKIAIKMANQTIGNELVIRDVIEILLIGLRRSYNKDTISPLDVLIYLERNLEGSSKISIN